MADNNLASKLKEAANQIDKVQAENRRLEAEVKAANAKVDTAVLQERLKLKSESFAAVQDAMDTGYNRAIANLQAMKGMGSQ